MTKILPDDEKEEKLKTNKDLPKANNKIDTEPTMDEAEISNIIEYVLSEDLSDFDEHKSTLDSMFEDLTMADRQKKALTIQRYRAKIDNARRRSLARRVNNKVIFKRAKTSAIDTFKQRFIKGKNISDASNSEKNRVEELERKRKKTINRMANRLVRDKRTVERARLKENKEETFDDLVESFNTIYDSITLEA